MTTQDKPAFSSLEAYHAETARLQGEYDKAVTFAESKKASEALKAHGKKLDAVLAANDSSWTGKRTAASATVLDAAWKDHGYESLEDLMKDHGYERKVAGKQPKATQRRPANKDKPKVFKYLLKDEHAGAVDENKKPLAKGYARKVDGIDTNPFYRTAHPDEITKMEKDLEAWTANNPKS